MALLSREALAERLWAKVAVTGPDACWLWQGHVNDDGYGRVYITSGRGRRPTRGAHRVAWEVTFGLIPEGRIVCHHCDNPRCVNPAHLFLGDDAANRRDCMTKGRVTGKVAPAVRDAAARAVLSGRAVQKDIAVALGVDPSCVSRWVSARRDLIDTRRV
jgi:hypothetical protein